MLRGGRARMSDASGVHACFVYLLEETATARPPRRVRTLRAPRGQVVLERGEGLAWWAVERGEPAFIRDDALADPRVEYVPELEEERFQSLLAVPIVGRAASPSVRSRLHTEAPREFTHDEVDFLVTSASLVAGAIENARLYEETRLRVARARAADGARRGDRARATRWTSCCRRSRGTRRAPSAPAPATSTCSIPASEELELRGPPAPGAAARRDRARRARARARPRRPEHAARRAARRERRARRPARRRGQLRGRARAGGREPDRGRRSRRSS